MNLRLVCAAAVCLLLVSGGNAPGQATPEPAKALPLVSPVFGDNMVLQRGKLNTIWGWAEPGETVRVDVDGKTATAVAGADRKW
jgi:sialate O-acetylesterase